MKTKLKTIIFSLFAIILSGGLFFSVNISTANSTFAASPVSYLDNSQRTQSNTILLSNAVSNINNGAGSTTINLYTSSADISNFDYYTSNDAGLEADDSRLFHKIKSPTMLSKGNGQFTTTLSLSKNIQVALKKGYISLDASAYICSPDCGYIQVIIKYYDKADDVTFDFYAYNNSNNSSLSKSETVTTFDSTYKQLSLANSELIGQDFDSLVLSFKSDLGGSGVYNSLEVKSPAVIISTTDVIKPTLNISASEDWAQLRVINLTATDGESGIYKVEVSKNGENYQTILDNSTSLTYSMSNALDYTISENGTYKFRVTDNVGNVYEKTYTETQIDTEKPSVEVLGIGEISTSKTFDFSANILSNVASQEDYYYTYTFNGNVSEPIPFVQGTNTFVAPENGEYTLTFYADDEAGNAIDPISKIIFVDDTLYQITTSAQNGTITPSFEANRSNGNVIEFSPSGDNSYFYKLLINGEEAKLSEGEIASGKYIFNITSNMEISVLYRQKVVLNITNEYTYNPNGFVVTHTANVDGDYGISYEYYDESKTNKLASIVGVGTYVVCYNIDNNEFFGSGEQTIVVSPKIITISSVQTEYEYNTTLQTLQFESSDNVPLIVTFYQNSEVKDFVNAGEYEYVITCENVNYSISASGVVTMKPHEIEVSVLENIFVYDGTAKELDYSLDTVVDGIQVEYFNNAKSNIIPVDAGEYTVKFSLSGNNNYTLNHTETLVISKRDITVSVNSQIITYGEAIPEITYSVSNSLENEKLIFDLNSSAISKNAGYYNITIKQSAGLTESEEQAFRNYNITYSNGYLEIKKAKLTVIPNEKQSKTYGEADSTLTFTTIGLIDGDVLEGALSREQGENVGYYNITIGTLSNSNYEIEILSKTFQILKRIAIVQIASTQKVYGELDPEFVIDFENSNILEKDKLLFNNNISREGGESVGTYQITFSKDNLNNYTVLSVSSTLEIMPKTLYVSANNISVVYGESEELTYEYFGLLAGDSITGSLSREAGDNVGEYQISLGTLSAKNYVIEFTSATYIISKRPITITAQNAEKTYGNADNLTYIVANAIDEIKITLVREAGENVGVYEIYGYSGELNNYDVTFVPATLTVSKKAIIVAVANVQKVYGELDPEFIYEVNGLINNDKVNISLSREVGENAGEYQINISSFESQNYVLENQTSGVLTINKADVYFELQDKEVTYSGEPATIDGVNFEFDLIYKYTFAGIEIDSPVNAGEYKVQAIFEGNENYNAFSSNIANLVINKKFIPITLKQSTFVYTGNEISPVYDINLNETVNVMISYENNAVPIEVGEYNFEIVSNNSNYYADFKGVLKIVSEFYTENTTGDASISSSNVSFSNSDISIYEDVGSPLMSTFSAFRDGRKCLSVYAFSVNNSSIEQGEVFTIRIKANAPGNDVKIYSVDKNGNMKSVSYTYQNGEYVISLNDLSASILITEADTFMIYAKIALTIIVVLVSYIIAKIVLKARNNRFFNRNTKTRKFNSEEIQKNSDIVASKVRFEDNMTADEYLSIK